jgi:phage shock protein A
VAERVRVLATQADADGEEVRTRVGMVEQLVDGFVERTRDAGQRVGDVEESSVGEVRESVERVRAEVARVDAEAEELRSRRAMLDELDDALVEAASESWQRVAAVEESSVGELQGAAERIRALLEQADADAVAARDRRTIGRRAPPRADFANGGRSRAAAIDELRRRGSISELPPRPTPRTTS